MSEAEFKQRIGNSKQILSLIIDDYVREGSPKEINITVRIRKPLMEKYGSGFFSPEILHEATEHILNLLRWNQRSKFLSQAQARSQNSSFASISSENKRGVGSKKATMKQIVMDELPSPHSLEDFKAFAKKEFVEESLEFMLKVIEYHKLASVYYPTSLMTKSNLTATHEVLKPTKPKNEVQQVFEAAIQHIQAQCLSIRENFIVPGSKQEINLPQNERKRVIDEIEAKIYHPEIFKSAFEHIANLLRINVLSKFVG